MASCPSCNKFAALEMQEPEVNDLEISMFDAEEDATELSGGVTYSVRICRNSECCGDEMKEGNFDGEIDLTVEGHTGEDCDLSVEEDGIEALEEGGGRYAKSYFGFELTGRVSCACGQDVKITECNATSFDADIFTITDKMAASEMDELV